MASGNYPCHVRALARLILIMVGVFDSGIGGLTVVSEILHRFPDAELTYIGDTARIPWGNKHPETIIHYSVQLTKFLLNKGAQTIVIACHTASSVALEAVRKTAPNTPIFEMITQSSQDAVAKSKNKKIGIIGTKTTINSSSWDKAIKKIDKSIVTFSQACPLFVPLVEEGLENHPATKLFIKDYLLPLQEKGIDSLVLACTHYPFLAKPMKEFLGDKIALINPGQSVARVLPQIPSGKIELNFTDTPSSQSPFLKLLETRPDATINTIGLEIIENDTV